MSKLQRATQKFQDGWISFLRVLARNSGLKFVVRPNEAPRTDGKTVYLPALPAKLTDDDLTLFKRTGYHEVGHCMHSNVPYYQQFNAEHGPFAGMLLNAVDDVYMEYAQTVASRRSEHYFRRGAAIMIDRQIFRDGSQSPQEAFASYTLCFLRSRRWSEYLPAVELIRENFDAHFGEHADQIRENLETILLAEYPNVRSTEDAGLLTLRLIEMLKQQRDQQDDQPKTSLKTNSRRKTRGKTRTLNLIRKEKGRAMRKKIRIKMLVKARAKMTIRNLTTVNPEVRVAMMAMQKTRPMTPRAKARGKTASTWLN